MYWLRTLSRKLLDFEADTGRPTLELELDFDFELEAVLLREPEERELDELDPRELEELFCELGRLSITAPRSVSIFNFSRL